MSISKMAKKKAKSPLATPPWYLDTSVFVSLLFGHPLVKDNIKKQLHGKSCWTSFYVQMEYKRKVVKTLVDFYYVAKEEDTPSNAFQVWSQRFESRSVKIILDALGNLLSESDISNDKDKFLIKLQTLIEAAIVRFDCLISGFVENQTRCPLCKASLANGHDGFLSEIECKTECSVDKVWRDNKKKLQVLAAVSKREPHLKNHGFTKPIPIIEASIQDPIYPKTKTRCKKVGDFIIALEMPSNMRMLTSDTSFQSLCPLLNRDFTILPSLTALRAARSPGSAQDVHPAPPTT